MKDAASQDMGGALKSVNLLAETNSTNQLTRLSGWHLKQWSQFSKSYKMADGSEEKTEYSLKYQAVFWSFLPK